MDPALGIYSSDLPVLEWCASITGVGRVRYTMNQSVLAVKPQYKWIVTARLDILGILRQIAPYMHIKQAIADRMIEELESYQGPTPTAGYSTVVQRQIHGRKNAYLLDGHTHV
jgi:hypothetical protein